METSEQQISLLITSSPGLASNSGVSDALGRITRCPISEQIEVQPFNDELLKKYLAACFGRTLLLEKERQDLISKTQGIPLLLAAFLKNLLAAKVIQYEAGFWILDRKLYNQVRIPTHLDQSLATALENLHEEQTTLLRLLALAGPMLKSDLTLYARSILKDPEQALAGLIEKAILIYRSDGAISFVHPLYSQFMIESTTSRILQDYSGRLADWLVSEESSDSLRIAQLCISAERVDEAVKYSLDAVDKIFSSYLLYDCLKLLLDLKDLVSRKGNGIQLLAVLDKLAPIEHRTGLPKEAIKDYTTLASSAPTDAQKANYYMQLARIHFGQLGDIRSSQTLLRKALRSARRNGDNALTAAVYCQLADMDIGNCALFYEKAANLSRKVDINLHLLSLASLAYSYQLVGKHKKASLIQKRVMGELHRVDSAAKSRIYHDFYCMSFFTADYKAARFYIAKKAQLEKKTENFPKLLSSMSSLAGCYYTEGSYYKMIDTLNETHRSAMRYNNYLIAIVALSNLSLAYRSVANYGESLRMLLTAEEIIEGERTQAPNVSYLNKPLMLYLPLGEFKDAEFLASAKRLYERARKTDNRIGLGHHSMAFTIYHLNKLQPDDALVHAKKALSFFRKAADRDDVVSALAHIAIIQLSMGKLKQARTNLNQAEEIYEAIHCDYLKPLLLLSKSMLARLEHADDARKILADALKVSKKMGTRETTWQIQREFALYYKDKGEPHRALASYKDAIETIKQITETIDEEELRLSYLQVPFRNRVFNEIKSLGSVPR
jgi:tetratricopeptide (TPR) repeat protein